MSKVKTVAVPKTEDVLYDPAVDHLITGIASGPIDQIIWGMKNRWRRWRKK